MFCIGRTRCWWERSDQRVSHGYRFSTKLRLHADKLDACIARVLASLHTAHPDMGRDVSIDASDLPAYANGQRFLSTTFARSTTPSRRGTAIPS